MVSTKKILTAVSAAALCLTLTGCSDASAKLKDSSTALFKVGNKTITKGQIYSTMVSMAGASTAINDATNTIASAEVEVTDDIKNQAQSTLKTYKTMYGDSFSSYLESANMDEDQYVNEYLIPSLLAAELNTKYVEEKWDDLLTMYKPVKATVLSFTSQDDRDAAMQELKDGSATASEAAKNHNSSSDGSSKVYTNQDTSLDTMVRAVLSSMKTSDGWVDTQSSDSATFYLLHVDDDDPEDYRDDLTETLSNLSNVKTDATTYYFKKYNFHIYDITLYNAVKDAYPDNLVQDMKDDTSDDSASATASASADSTN